jgi:uncharacterized protein (TIGR00251 family)
MPLKIWVIVKPQAKKRELKKITDEEYAVSVHAPARQGRANEAVIELLAERFSVPKSSVHIIRGEKGKRKLVQIA